MKYTRNMQEFYSKYIGMIRIPLQNLRQLWGPFRYARLQIRLGGGSGASKQFLWPAIFEASKQILKSIPPPVRSKSRLSATMPKG